MSKDEQTTKIVRELKRRGYTVTQTVDDALLIEKDTFWGKFAYDTGIGKDGSGIKWLRIIIAAFFYGLGLIAAVYWLWKKGELNKEVLSLVQGYG